MKQTGSSSIHMYGTTYSTRQNVLSLHVHTIRIFHVCNYICIIIQLQCMSVKSVPLKAICSSTIVYILYNLYIYLHVHVHCVYSPITVIFSCHVFGTIIICVYEYCYTRRETNKLTELVFNPFDNSYF